MLPCSACTMLASTPLPLAPSPSHSCAHRLFGMCTADEVGAVRYQPVIGLDFGLLVVDHLPVGAGPPVEHLRLAGRVPPGLQHRGVAVWLEGFRHGPAPSTWRSGP